MVVKMQSSIAKMTKNLQRGGPFSLQVIPAAACGKTERTGSEERGYGTGADSMLQAGGSQIRREKVVSWEESEDKQSYLPLTAY